MGCTEGWTCMDLVVGEGKVPVLAPLTAWVGDNSRVLRCHDRELRGSTAGPDLARRN